MASASLERTTSSAPSRLASAILLVDGGELHDVRAEGVGELQPHVSESAQADDADLLARARAPVAQRRVGGDARAEQRSDAGELVAELRRDGVDVAHVADDVVGVAAVGDRAVVAPGVVGADEALDAVVFQARLAVGADAAGVDQHADAGQVAGLEPGHLRADRRHAADDLVAGHHGIHRAAPLVAHLVDVGVADAAVGDLDDHIARARFAALKAVGTSADFVSCAAYPWDFIEISCC